MLQNLFFSFFFLDVFIVTSLMGEKKIKTSLTLPGVWFVAAVASHLSGTTRWLAFPCEVAAVSCEAKWTLSFLM